MILHNIKALQQAKQHGELLKKCHSVLRLTYHIATPRFSLLCMLSHLFLGEWSNTMRQVRNCVKQGRIPAVIEGLFRCGSPLWVEGEQAAQQVEPSFRKRAAIKVEAPDGKLAVERWSGSRELELQPTQQMFDQQQEVRYHLARLASLLNVPSCFMKDTCLSSAQHSLYITVT